LSSGESAPSPRDAKAIGDLSPAWASRAVLSESRSAAEAKAFRASSTQVEISSTRIGKVYLEALCYGRIFDR